MYGRHTPEFGDAEFAGGRSRGPFPAAWGQPPGDPEQIAGWAAAKIRAAASSRRRPVQGVEAAADLRDRFPGIDGAEALAQLRRRFVDPTMTRPTMTADDAIRALTRRAARYATSLRMVAESPW